MSLDIIKLEFCTMIIIHVNTISYNNIIIIINRKINGIMIMKSYLVATIIMII